MENTLELIDLKKKKYKLLKFFNIFLASLFSLIGTVSIVSFLMFLNMYLGVGYFTCFVLTFVLSQIYSVIVNELLLKKIENRMNNILLKIRKMECKYNVKQMQRQKNDDLESRYEKLSLDRKLELLTYAKEKVTINDKIDEIDSIHSLGEECSFDDVRTIPFENGYSRRRSIKNERDKRNYS